MEEYTAREEYQQEMQRRSRYDLLFDFLRAAMVLVLVVRFGGAPLMRYLDSQVQHVRDRLGEAAETRRAAQEQALAMIAQEQEDRVRNEELMAKRALKKELVEEALRILEADYAAKRTPESEAALVDKFVEQMELVR